MNKETLESFEFFGNSGVAWFWTAIIFVGLMIIFKIFAGVAVIKLKKVSEKTKTDIDDFIISLIKHIWPPFYYFVALYVALQFVEIPQMIGKTVFALFIIVVVLQIILTAQKIIDYVISKKFLKPSDENIQDKEGIVKFTGQIIKGALWALGGLMVLDNLGVNVTSLVASLGIGGVAIALAVKDTLGDIFASISILIDKPFRVGDFVGLSAKEQGTVEKIGIKTTRMRTREGHLLVVANKKLTDSTLTNFKKKGKRQIIFILGVTYETPLEKLKTVPVLISELIEKNENTTVGRVVFKEFADSALNFEVVFTIESTDKSDYHRVREEINYAILEVFQKEGIEMAYPTQTLLINKV